ncbi:hypothetical protein PMAYCL1PPCAC_03112, partial [Pristionchus mayeri]
PLVIDVSISPHYNMPTESQLRDGHAVTILRHKFGTPLTATNEVAIGKINDCWEDALFGKVHTGGKLSDIICKYRENPDSMNTTFVTHVVKGSSAFDRLSSEIYCTFLV